MRKNEQNLRRQRTGSTQTIHLKKRFPMTLTLVLWDRSLKVTEVTGFRFILKTWHHGLTVYMYMEESIETRETRIIHQRLQKVGGNLTCRIRLLSHKSRKITNDAKTKVSYQSEHEYSAICEPQLLHLKKETI